MWWRRQAVLPFSRAKQQRYSANMHLDICRLPKQLGFDKDLVLPKDLLDQAIPSLGRRVAVFVEDYIAYHGEK